MNGLTRVALAYKDAETGKTMLIEHSVYDDQVPHLVGMLEEFGKQVATECAPMGDE